MADITPTRVNSAGATRVYTWANMTENDTAMSVLIAHYADKTVQVVGTVQTSVDFEGSNDGVNYHTLTDGQGNPLSFTGPGLELVAENPLHVRPKTPVGVGSDVTVILTVKG